MTKIEQMYKIEEGQQHIYNTQETCWKLNWGQGK